MQLLAFGSTVRCSVHACTPSMMCALFLTLAFSYTLAQAFAISPAPVVIGALTIESPVLTTKCGGNLMLQSDDVIAGFE